MDTRRHFIQRSLTVPAAAAGLALSVGPESAVGATAAPAGARRASGSQRRWRAAFGLNGFMSSEHEFRSSYDACHKGRLAIESARRDLGRG